MVVNEWKCCFVLWYFHSNGKDHKIISARQPVDTIWIHIKDTDMKKNIGDYLEMEESYCYVGNIYLWHMQTFMIFTNRKELLRFSFHNNIKYI